MHTIRFKTHPTPSPLLPFPPNIPHPQQTQTKTKGYFHDDVTFAYIWWPAIECARLFALTLARTDAILKINVESIRQSPSAFALTRWCLMGCNMLGAIWIIIFAPIYFLFLPRNGNDILYTVFMSVFPMFVLIRLLLSIPMFIAFIWGTPIYRLHDGNGYERIDDGPNANVDLSGNPNANIDVTIANNSVNQLGRLPEGGQLLSLFCALLCLVLGGRGNILCNMSRSLTCCCGFPTLLQRLVFLCPKQSSCLLYVVRARVPFFTPPRRIRRCPCFTSPRTVCPHIRRNPYPRNRTRTPPKRKRR